MATGRDLYGELGVERTASAEDIRKAYRKLARKFHPDVNPGNKDAEERFKRINAAYEVLGNDEKRSAYDEFGEDSLKGGFDVKKAREFRDAFNRQRQGGARPFSGFGDAGPGGAGFGDGGFGGAGFGAGGFPGFGLGGEPGGGFAFDPDDLLDGMLGRRRNVQRRPQGKATVEISLAEAIKGTQVALQWRGMRACDGCGGTGSADASAPSKCARCKGTGRNEAGGGRVRMVQGCDACGGTGWTRVACRQCSGVGQVEATETLQVRIPPGADDGSRLKVPRGNGEEIVLETRVKPHPYFRREGLDLHLRLPVTLDEAYNGGKVRVPTADGTVDMTVPARTQNGTRLRLRGKGITRGGRTGDLYVEVELRLPEGEHPALATAAREANRAYTRDVRSDVKL